MTGRTEHLAQERGRQRVDGLPLRVQRGLRPVDLGELLAEARGDAALLVERGKRDSVERSRFARSILWIAGRVCARRASTWRRGTRRAIAGSRDEVIADPAMRGRVDLDASGRDAGSDSHRSTRRDRAPAAGRDEDSHAAGACVQRREGALQRHECDVDPPDRADRATLADDRAVATRDRTSRPSESRSPSAERSATGRLRRAESPDVEWAHPTPVHGCDVRSCRESPASRAAALDAGRRRLRQAARAGGRRSGAARRAAGAGSARRSSSDSTGASGDSSLRRDADVIGRDLRSQDARNAPARILGHSPSTLNT